MKGSGAGRQRLEVPGSGAGGAGSTMGAAAPSEGGLAAGAVLSPLESAGRERAKHTQNLQLS